jgi:hypothetical protein
MARLKADVIRCTEYGVVKLPLCGEDSAEGVWMREVDGWRS